MSSRKVMGAPDVRHGVPGNRRKPHQARGFWEWLFGELYT